MKATVRTDNLDVDERRRIEQHEQVKEQVRDKVHHELGEKAAAEAPTDQVHIEGLAREMKQRAVSEVSASEADLARARGVARVSQVIDYLFYVLYGLIGVRIVLELIAAREASGFKQLMNAITAPFLAPFKGLVTDPSVGSSQLMLSFIAALVVYVLLHVAINGALRLFVSRKTTV
jgi:uncharacterized protein YggT (Ycf19 family)